MIKISAMVLISLLATSSFAAQDYYFLCTKNDAKKNIAVIYENDSSNVPCKVTYTKQGQTKTLWHAQAQEGYCEKKAAKLAATQSDKGWFCKRN